MRFARSIKRQLVLILIVLAVGPMLLFSVLAFMRAKAMMTEQTLDHLNTMIEEESARLDLVVELLQKRLASAADRSGLISDLSNYAVIDQSPPMPLIEDDLFAMSQQIPFASGLSVFDSFGEVVASYPATLMSVVGYPIAGLQPSQSGYSVHLGANAHKKASLFLVYDLALSSEIQYSVVLEVACVDIFNLTRSLKASAVGEQLMLIEPSGAKSVRVVSSRAPDRVHEILLDSEEKLQESTIVPFSAQSENSTSDAVDYRGKRVLASKRFLGNLGIGLVRQVDYAVAFKSIEEMRSGFTQLFISVLALVVAVALALTKRLHTAVAYLSEYVRGVAAGGQNEADAELLHFDEYRALALDVQYMAEDIRQSDRRFQIAVESAPNGVIITSGTGVITLVNREVERLFGYSQIELIGQPIEILTPTSMRSQLASYREELLKSSDPKSDFTGGNLYGLRKDGTHFPIEVGISPIEDEDGLMFLGSIVDITVRKQAEQQLMDSLHEKELLLKEIHHRVKNNMQIISSLLKLQAGYSNNSSQNTAAIFQESHSRVRSMALVHEKLYQSDQLSRIDFSEYLRDLAADLIRGYARDPSKITLRLALAPTDLGIDQAIPCGLLINELITNVLKHAVRTDGAVTLTISMERDEAGGVTLIVADDGPGLPESFNIEGSKTLGMQLVQTLVAQLNGQLKIRNENGCVFEIQFASVVQLKGVTNGNNRCAHL